MAKTKKSDTKDSARKRTLNPPGSRQKVRAEERDLDQRQGERQIGQYAGAGTPPFQKK